MGEYKPTRASSILNELGKIARFVRYYPAIADTLRPYAEASRGSGAGFSADRAAIVLVRAMELTGTSTLPECWGTDWFEKSDTQFAADVGMGLYEFRAARSFLTGGGIRLIIRRDLRNPIRTHYRADFDRIEAFLSPAVAGYGQLVLIDHPPWLGKTQPEVRKNPTLH